MRRTFTYKHDGKTYMLLSKQLRDDLKVYIFREHVLYGWKPENKFPVGKEIIINKRTGIPFLKSIKNGEQT